MAEHVNKLLGEDAEARQLQKSFEQRCTEDRWSQGMRECLTKTTSMNSPKNCRMYLNDMQQQRWDAMLATTAAATANQLPESCALYATMVQRAQKCESLSREVRAELATRLAAHQAEWAKLGDKSSLAGACGSAMAVLRNAGPDCFK
jgi:C4-dicarboxylate-specific signal transduction histidine kinase